MPGAAAMLMQNRLPGGGPQVQRNDRDDECLLELLLASRQQE